MDLQQLSRTSAAGAQVPEHLSCPRVYVCLLPGTSVTPRKRTMACQDVCLRQHSTLLFKNTATSVEEKPKVENLLRYFNERSKSKSHDQASHKKNGRWKAGWYEAEITDKSGTRADYIRKQLRPKDAN
jgi:hypothetical protein